MVFILTLFLVLLFLYPVVPVHLIYEAHKSGLKVRLIDLIGMRFRSIRPTTIIYPLIRAYQANIKHITISDLESHTLAGGDVSNLIESMIHAKNNQINLDYRTALAIDLCGRNLFLELQKCIDSPTTDSILIESYTKDNSRILLKITLQTHRSIAKVVGGHSKEELLNNIKNGIEQMIQNSLSKVAAEKQIKAILTPKKLNEHFQGSSYDVLVVDFTL